MIMQTLAVPCGQGFSRRLLLILCVLAGLILLANPNASHAASGLPALTLSNSSEQGETWSISIQLLVLMTLLTVLPSLLISMTAFTRIMIVMAILRQAMGTMNTPSNQVLIGLSLFLTFFIMAPVFERIHTEALAPWLEESITSEQALERAKVPLSQFMLAQTRETDLALFVDLRQQGDLNSRDEVPFSVLVPAFMTSELKTAFQIGFLLFIPFLIIDLVVASVLMSMGMVMLSPMMVSTPFKLLLFVLVDGWTLLMGTMAASFFNA